MNSTIKWTLLSLSIPALIACGGGSSSSDDVTTPTIEPKPTLFAATNQGENAKVNSRIRLDGSSSYDLEGSALTYNWVITSKPDGSSATLSKSDSISPTFDPDVAGTYVVELTVSNGSKTSKASSVTFEVSADADNAAPNVHPVPSINAVADSEIELSANAKDADAKDQLTYAWTVTKQPTDATPVLTNETTEKASFTGNISGDYQVQVEVSDGTETVTKTINVKVVNGNVAPVANAFAFTTPAENTSEPVNLSNAATFEIGSEATLDASHSFDANTSDTLEYQWAVVSKPSGSSAGLSENTAAKPTFIPDVVGEYTFSLTVNDGQESSSKDFVRVSATESGTSQIKLFDKDGNELNMPFKLEELKNIDLNGATPEYVDIASYRFEATGADFKLIDVNAFNVLSPSSTPLIEGVKKFQTIHAGDYIDVHFKAKPTNGVMHMVSFNVTFSLDPEVLVSTGYMLTTN
ncbi:exported hypothetical protein [Vibrio nigripulchritudo SO65]|uniref:PKD domain-containing protein n=1 Tax=Vibrio nigripulchritudo TaxID=28173 RepID=UPI0003B1DDA6|nr:hypothetical protein [Vibrio nigripulchritudo]CCN33373.1 exported hypothetical protein [Vibrio nigripulchritudo AM115]CCN42914.1 exported hypothetical protein [Vibrio nigripulchritudo FTn2]CCN65444.1 exported hypothetical protein [Vibrio nigripulchritudo POn4]CCN79509.1 exported hypothetical protein [Vibrio nigripulchritudo SO65]